MKKITVISISVLLSSILVACGGGGSSSSTSTGDITGIAVPTEISAVPTNAGVGGASLSSMAAGLGSRLRALAVNVPSDSDYATTQTTRYVEEHTLDQFDIIQQILSALNQAHYYDASVVNQGPYTAMIAWEEENNGIAYKKLEPWIVDSSMTTENGREVNVVKAWIAEKEGSQDMTVRAKFKIYAAPTRNSDGSYQNYGEWTVNANFGGDDSSYFAASASVDSNGAAVITVNEHQQRGPGQTQTMRAVLHKDADSGYGQVEYPDWSNCNSPNCTPATVAAKYAYNDSYLALQKSTDPVEYLDRNETTEMVHRYGVFDSVTGQNIMRDHSFGFPIQFSLNGETQYGYYGSWQGRHQIWAGNNMDPADLEGLTVTRQDRGPDQPAETYTISQPFKGTLVKRTLVSASVADIQGIPVETWVNDHFSLKYDSGVWKTMNCQPGVLCTLGSVYTDWDALTVDDGDSRKHVSIGGENSLNSPPVQYVYLPSSDSRATAGAGLYQASFDNVGQLTSVGSLYAPSQNARVFVNINGSIFIEYTGTGATGWTQKTVAWDEQNWMPTFSGLGDTDYLLPLDKEYYINNQGVNYIVKRTSGGYVVQMESQSVASPVNVASFLGDASQMLFKAQWNPDVNATYTFDTDPNSATYMKLVYASVGSEQGVGEGDVVTGGQWGLVAYVNGVAQEDQYNWDYPTRAGENWGTMQYLLDGNSSYKMLDDPIQLETLALINAQNVTKNFVLRFDGWMHGMPDLYNELRKNGFEMSAEIKDKIYMMDSADIGEIADAIDASKHYLIKPLEISVFLNVPQSTTGLILPDITLADSVDLSADTPSFQPHTDMDIVPSNAEVKYSEGEAVS